MNVAEIMVHAVLAIDADAPLAQAIRLMTEHHVSGLPVVDGSGKLIGILTEGDLLRRAETGTEGAKPGWLARFLVPGNQAARYIRTHGRKVSEVMTDEVVSVSEGTPVSQAVDLMEKHRVRRIPVVRDGRLVGIVSRADLVRRLGEELSRPAVAGDDATTERAVRAAVDRESWAPGHMVTITVHDGVAELDGCVFDVRERAAVGVIAENTPGVTKVENRIICVDPYAGIVTYDPAAAIV